MRSKFLLAMLLLASTLALAKEHRFSYRVFYLSSDTAGVSCYSGALPFITQAPGLVTVSCK